MTECYNLLAIIIWYFCRHFILSFIFIFLRYIFDCVVKALLQKLKLQVTENLSALVARMSDQLALSETTTSTLIHSSALLKGTEVEFSSMAAHIQVWIIIFLYIPFRSAQKCARKTSLSFTSLKQIHFFGGNKSKEII